MYNKLSLYFGFKQHSFVAKNLLSHLSFNPDYFTHLNSNTIKSSTINYEEVLYHLRECVSKRILYRNNYFPEDQTYKDYIKNKIILQQKIITFLNSLKKLIIPSTEDIIFPSYVPPDNNYTIPNFLSFNQLNKYIQSIYDQVIVIINNSKGVPRSTFNILYILLGNNMSFLFQVQRKFIDKLNGYNSILDNFEDFSEFFSSLLLICDKEELEKIICKFDPITKFNISTSLMQYYSHNHSDDITFQYVIHKYRNSKLFAKFKEILSLSETFVRSIFPLIYNHADFAMTLVYNFNLAFGHYMIGDDISNRIKWKISEYGRILTIEEVVECYFIDNANRMINEILLLDNETILGIMEAIFKYSMKWENTEEKYHISFLIHVEVELNRIYHNKGNFNEVFPTIKSARLLISKLVGNNLKKEIGTLYKNGHLSSKYFGELILENYCPYQALKLLRTI